MSECRHEDLCHASSYGLGAVLLQKKISHGNASRAMTSTECRYAQVEKGMAQNFDSGKY